MTTPSTLFVAQGDLNWPSSRYRAWWVAKYAEWAEVAEAREFYGRTGDPASGYRAVVLPKGCSREVIRAMTVMRNKGHVLIWDLCDPLWWIDPRGFNEMLPLVDYLVFSNAGLEGAFVEEYGDNRTAVIPDRMDPEFHPTVREHRETPAPVLLWYGIGWNRALSLGSAALGLQRLLNEGARLRLRILDDGPAGGVNIDGVDVEYHRWRLDTFHEELLAADIALCPPCAGPWGRMKSNNKEVTAWWAGLPAVHLQTADDMDYAHALIADADLRAKEGWVNRKRAMDEWDVRQSVKDWEQLLGGFDAD